MAVKSWIESFIASCYEPLATGRYSQKGLKLLSSALHA